MADENSIYNISEWSDPNEGNNTSKYAKDDIVVVFEVVVPRRLKATECSSDIAGYAWFLRDYQTLAHILSVLCVVGAT